MAGPRQQGPPATATAAIRRAGAEPQHVELPMTNHVGLNMESFAAEARGRYHIPDDAILHTVAGLEAVFDSADADGAWRWIR